MHYPIFDIKTIEIPLSLSVHFGGLVPGRNLVLVCWEHVTIRRRVDDQFVAVWVNCLGALVTAFVTAASTAATRPPPPPLPQLPPPPPPPPPPLPPPPISLAMAARRAEFCCMMSSNCFCWVSSSMRSKFAGSDLSGVGVRSFATYSHTAVQVIP
jgi:hypothetical protein